MIKKLITTFFLFLVANFAVMELAYASDKADDKFAKWLDEFKQEATLRGIKKHTLDSSLATIKPIKRIIELDRKQPEGSISFVEYIQRVLPQSRAKKAIRLYNKNSDLLKKITDKYKVQGRFIVALWGMESDFGSNMGSFHVPEALATLAYDGRRSEFFRKELHNAIKIIDEGHIGVRNMKGSWAGAMGQTQFMPSSFLSYAVDENGDGRRDIWKTKSDVFASIATYLSKSGWDFNGTWGRRVILPDDFDKKLVKNKVRKPLPYWQKLGIRRMDGRDLPKRTDLIARIVIPAGNKKNNYKGDAFLVYKNYDIIMKWNRSEYFATAIGMLSDEIDKGKK